MNEGGAATTEEWAVARDTYYWYARAEGTEIVEVCEWALEEASNAKDFAHVATLLAGTGYLTLLGPRLEAKIAEHLQLLHASQRRADALADARFIGEALSTIRRGLAPDR